MLSFGGFEHNLFSEFLYIYIFFILSLSPSLPSILILSLSLTSSICTVSETPPLACLLEIQMHPYANIGSSPSQLILGY